MEDQEVITNSRIINHLLKHFTSVTFNVNSSSDIFSEDEFSYEKRMINKILDNTYGRFFYKFKKFELFLGFEMESDLVFLSLVFPKILAEINSQ